LTERTAKTIDMASSCRRHHSHSVGVMPYRGGFISNNDSLLAKIFDTFSFKKAAMTSFHSTKC